MAVSTNFHHTETPSLLLAVLANNEGAVQECLRANHSQRVSGSCLKCRDVSYRQLLPPDPSSVEERLRQLRIYDTLVESKVAKTLRKLQIYEDSPIDEPKARRIFSELITLEATCKLLVDQKAFQKVTSTAQTSFYLLHMKDTSCVLKDRVEEFNFLCETEAFIYKLAWVMRLEDCFIPTKKIWIDPNRDQPGMLLFKVAMQLFMDPKRYRPLGLSHEQTLATQESVIKAILVEIFFGLGNSEDSNLRYDTQSRGIVHLNMAPALRETNGYDPHMYPYFHSDLLQTLCCLKELDQNEIDHIRAITNQFMQHSEGAINYFKRHFPKMCAKEKEWDLDNEEQALDIQKLQNAKLEAWQERIAAMQKAVAKLENGSIKTLLDFTLFCFPCKKECVYTSLGLALITRPSEEFRTPVYEHLIPKSLLSLLDQYATQGISYKTYCQVRFIITQHHSIPDFIRYCMELKLEKERPNPQLRSLYQATAQRICFKKWDGVYNLYETEKG